MGGQTIGQGGSGRTRTEAGIRVNARCLRTTIGTGSGWQRWSETDEQESAGKEIAPSWNNIQKGSATATAVAAEVGADVAVVELFTGSLGEPGTVTDTLIGLLLVDAERIAKALGS